MNKGIATLILSVIFFSSYAQDETKRHPLQAAVDISLNSNGISTIPAFNLGDPAIMSFITLNKGRFSYDPVLAYGLDIRPWFIDNWLHYRIISKEKFVLRSGVNFSMFFTDLELPDLTTLQGQRYWAFELAGFYNVSGRSTVSLMYWNDRGQDPGTIIGHYLSLAGEIRKIRAGKLLEVTVSAQLFYIDYTAENDGLFISPKITASPLKTPFWLVFQANQPIVTNISPYPGFEWNVGIGVSF